MVELAVVVALPNPEPNEKLVALADFVTSGALKLMVGVTDAVVSVGFLSASEPRLKLITGFGVIVDETVAEVIGVESSVFTVDVLKSTLKPVVLDVVKVLAIESNLVVETADNATVVSCFPLSFLVDADSVVPNLRLLFFARSKVGSFGDSVDVAKENPEEAPVEDAGRPRGLDKELFSDDSVVTALTFASCCGTFKSGSSFDFFVDLSSSDSKALNRFSTFLSFITRSCSKSFGFNIKGSGASIFGLSGDLDFETMEVFTRSEIDGKITFLLVGEVLADPASTPCLAFSWED